MAAASSPLLRELGIERDTLLIFTTDNDSATGARVFNAGMRGAKGSEYEGGHRVPFTAHRPAAGRNKRHVNDTLRHAVDIVPTLLEITGADVPGATRAYRARPGAAIPAVTAALRLDSRDLATKPVQPGDKEISFTAQLTAGSHQLAPVFLDASGNEIGAYYAIITKRP